MPPFFAAGGFPLSQMSPLLRTARPADQAAQLGFGVAPMGSIVVAFRPKVNQPKVWALGRLKTRELKKYIYFQCLERMARACRGSTLVLGPTYVFPIWEAGADWDDAPMRDRAAPAATLKIPLGKPADLP
jgi:hypothetical protein